jgi:serine/threonine protein kinase
MRAERVVVRDLATPERSESRRSGLGDRVGSALASPVGVVIIIPALVAAVGLFLTLLGQNALMQSTTRLGGDRFAEQTSFISRSIAASLAHADPMLDRMRELAVSLTPEDPPAPLAYALRGLVQGRPGIAYASVSFPNGAFRGVYLDDHVWRFADSTVTPRGTIMRRYELSGNGALTLRTEEPSAYDPRTRDFYKLALSARGRTWTKAYPFFGSHQTGVTRTEPVFDTASGELRAVLTADFDVHSLSESMAHTPLRGVKTLLYTSDGTLLAYPEGAATLARMPLQSDRPVALADLRDPVIDAFFRSSRSARVAPGSFMQFTSGPETMLAMVSPVSEFHELGWNVAGIVPERVFFSARIEYERQSRWVAAVSMLVALSIAFVFARHVVRVRREAASAREQARRVTQQVRELGSYRLIELLGEGGMGEVWRAEHRLLARQAAVKLIRAERLAKTGRPASHVQERFRREAQSLALLKSRHTISLFDYGVADDGTFFFVMELLDGMDLETLVQQDGPQPVGRVIHILLQALSSLAEAHAAGLVHRDIKPANLFVCRAADEVDIVKVLDFGLVQSGGEGGSSQLPPDRTLTELAELAASRITLAGQLLGTPAYMSPEQILGHDTDGRSDLYALGCVAVWLLSGTVPFASETAMAVMLAHVTQAPPELSKLVPHPIPPELDQIIVQCLAKAPADRPRDAATLAAQLGAIAVPPEQRFTGDHAREWWKRARVGPRAAQLRDTDTVPVAL